jgi:hypothetical protein
MVTGAGDWFSEIATRLRWCSLVLRFRLVLRVR